ncbi:unnamed protein product, partial [Mesorhabditis spiculigera]
MFLNSSFSALLCGDIAEMCFSRYLALLSFFHFTEFLFTAIANRRYLQAIRKLAMVHAGVAFTPRLATSKQADLVTDGIYSWFRHPGYAGWFIWSVSTQIVLCNPICAVLYFIASYRFFRHRVMEEERGLLQFFGPAYVKYQAKVPSGIPFVYAMSTRNMGVWELIKHTGTLVTTDAMVKCAVRSFAFACTSSTAILFGCAYFGITGWIRMVANGSMVCYEINKRFCRQQDWDCYIIGMQALHIGFVFMNSAFVALLCPEPTVFTFARYLALLSFFHFTEFLFTGITNRRSLKALRKVAMVHAGVGFTHRLANSKQADHLLVTNGVYSWFRHPGYTGWFLWSVSTQIVLCNPICTVLYFIASYLFFRDRLIEEEKDLLQFFGPAYAKYQAELIYDIFNWTTNEKARITVIAIANTLDLPERLLSQRVSSRLGSNRLCFDPYDFRQIEQIINGRFKDTGAFDDKALQLASRKVAALSGDLRKAIDIMRQAGEIAVRKKSEKILIEHVQAAIAESQATIRMAYIASLSEHELILFKALVAEVQAKGVEEIRFAELYKQYQIQAHDTYAVMGEMMVRERVSKLASMRLLVLAPVTNNPASRNWFLKKIRLAISLQECNFILNSIEEKENR